MNERHGFRPGTVIDTLPPVHYCTCGRRKDDPIHAGAHWNITFHETTDGDRTTVHCVITDDDGNALGGAGLSGHNVTFETYSEVVTVYQLRLVEIAVGDIRRRQRIGLAP